MIKLRIKRWAGHVVRIAEIINVFFLQSPKEDLSEDLDTDDRIILICEILGSHGGEYEV
jgi:hypothetical protein